MSNDLDIKCRKKGEEFLCVGTRGKKQGAVMMRAGKEGLSIEGQDGNKDIANELIEHMQRQGKVKIKNGLDLL